VIWDAATGQDTIFHVRGNDFLTDGQSKQIPADYYRAAWEKLEAPRFVVITDDIQHAVALMKKADIRPIYTLSNSAVTDFGFLRFAKNLVISNSTFSWWAAFLSGARVIQPVPKGGDKCPIRNLVVPAWEQIEY
jgi:hypothetical protein